MTPQLREALQAVKKLTPAERQEFLRIVSNQQSGSDNIAANNFDLIANDTIWQGRPFTTLEDFAFSEWPEDETVDDFMHFTEERKKLNRPLSKQGWCS